MNQPYSISTKNAPGIPKFLKGITTAWMPPAEMPKNHQFGPRFGSSGRSIPSARVTIPGGSDFR